MLPNMSVIVLLSAVGVKRFVVHSTTCKSQFHSFVIHRRTPQANPGADNKPEDALNRPTPVNAKGNMSTLGPVKPPASLAWTSWTQQPPARLWMSPRFDE